MILGVIEAVTSNGVTLVIDGEETATEKEYNFLSPYNPTAGDRVLIEEIGESLVVLGKITNEYVAPIITEAEHALEADHALNADNATHATRADTATSATSATSANTATTATRATNADHATKADTATSATSATNATTADKATKCSYVHNNYYSETSSSTYPIYFNKIQGSTICLKYRESSNGVLYPLAEGELQLQIDAYGYLQYKKKTDYSWHTIKYDS